MSMETKGKKTMKVRDLRINRLQEQMSSS